MRIISQDGCYDIPYDQAVLNRIGTTISAKTNTGDLILLAQYHKEEKAIKAMEMCAREYEDWEVTAFKFPKDSEVEV